VEFFGHPYRGAVLARRLAIPEPGSVVDAHRGRLCRQSLDLLPFICCGTKRWADDDRRAAFTSASDVEPVTSDIDKAPRRRMVAPVPRLARSLISGAG